MPGQTFTANATTSASTSQIWERFQVPETWEGITGVQDVFEPRFDAEKLVGFKFHSTAGGRRYVGTATPGPREEERSLQWDIATSEIKGWVTVDLTPVESTTRIDVTMRVESVSVLASFGFPLIAGAIANGFQETVDAFAKALES